MGKLGAQDLLTASNGGVGHGHSGPRAPVKGGKAGSMFHFAATLPQVARALAADDPQGVLLTGEGVRVIQRRALIKCRDYCEREGLDLESLLIGG